MEAARYALMHDLLWKPRIGHAHTDTPWVMEQALARPVRSLVVSRRRSPRGGTGRHAIGHVRRQGLVGVVPFMLENLHARGLPGLPGAKTFPELNVRTYVTLNGKPGVYFFSLDAGSKLAVIGARTLFNLPYFEADMTVVQTPTGIGYTSRRTDERGKPATFDGHYASVGEALNPQSGTLEHFLQHLCIYPERHFGGVQRQFIIDRGCCKPRRRKWTQRPCSWRPDCRRRAATRFSTSPRSST